MFKVTINPGEACTEYGVNTHAGFDIASQKPLSKEDFFKIRQIIGSFVELQRAQEEHQILTKQYKEGVDWQKQGEQPEQEHYWNSVARLQDTELTMHDLKRQHNIVQISTFVH